MDDLSRLATNDLKRRAKASYETGRWLDALPWLLPVIVWTGICWRMQAAIWPAPILLALVLLLRVVGQDWGKGVRLGLGAGMLAGSYPLLLACTTSCGPQCALECSVWAFGSGAAAGTLFYRRLAPRTAIAALVVCACTASMACLAMGAAGLYGTLAVVVFGSGLQLVPRQSLMT